jgi:hypothetical protein
MTMSAWMMDLIAKADAERAALIAAGKTPCADCGSTTHPLRPIRLTDMNDVKTDRDVCPDCFVHWRLHATPANRTWAQVDALLAAKGAR